MTQTADRRTAGSEPNLCLQALNLLPLSLLTMEVSIGRPLPLCSPLILCTLLYIDSLCTHIILFSLKVQFEQKLPVLATA